LIAGGSNPDLLSPERFRAIVPITSGFGNRADKFSGEKTSPRIHTGYLKSAFVLWTGFEPPVFPLVFGLSDGFGALEGADGPPGVEGVSVFLPEPACVDVTAFDEQPAVPDRANATAAQRSRNFFTRVAPSMDHGNESVRLEHQGATFARSAPPGNRTPQPRYEWSGGLLRSLCLAGGVFLSGVDPQARLNRWTAREPPEDDKKQERSPQLFHRSSSC
jgi:hypothetical protein